MKIRTLTFILSILIVVLITSLTFFNYNGHKKEYSALINKSIESSIENIKDDLNKSQKVINSVLDYKKENFKKIHELALKRLKENENISLENLQKELNESLADKYTNIHIYLIDKQYLIYNTTYKNDLNLNLGQFKGAKDYIDISRKEKEKTFLAEPTLDVQTGEYRVYTYSSLDESTVLELGFFDSGVNEIKKHISTYNVTNIFVEGSELFANYGNYVINLNKSYENSSNISKEKFIKNIMESNNSEEIKIVNSVSKTKNSYEYELNENDESYRIKYIYLDDVMISFESTKNYVIKLIINTSRLEDKLYTHKTLFYVSFFLCLIFIISLFRFFETSYIKPLESLIAYIKQWKYVNDEELIDNKSEIGILVNQYNESLLKSKRMNEKFIEHSKKAAMGEMIENIAHQWKQPLSIISVGASGLSINNQLKEVSKDELEEVLTDIDNATKFMNSTIIDFREFFKIDKPKTLFKIGSVAKKAEALLSSKLIRKKVKVLKDIEDISYYGFENELIHVMINFFSNSIDAHETNESLEKVILLKIYKKDNTIFISVKDNAKGINENIIKKVFDDHFTTKGDDGTGIGLYINKKIIEEHFDGKISVQNKKFEFNNEINKGANFKVEFPLVEE